MFATTASAVTTNSPCFNQQSNINAINGTNAINGALTDPKYTIEQIELLRRLKNSGLSKLQIVQGLDTLEKLDTNGFTTPVDLQAVKEEPKSNVKHAAVPGNLTQLGSLSSTTGADYLRTLALQQAFISAMTNNSFMNGNAHMHTNGAAATLAQRNLAAALMCSQGVPNPGSLITGAGVTNGGVNGGLPFNLGSTNAAENSILSQMSHLNGNGGSPGGMKRESSGTNGSLGDPNTISDDDEHLVQLQSMSVVETKEEIKNFMMTHGIKQHQVAEKTGVSQSYISQFLHQGVWMKDSTRTNIYKWYLDEKRKREANGELASPGNSTNSGVVSPSSSADATPQTPPNGCMSTPVSGNLAMSNAVQNNQMNNNNQGTFNQANQTVPNQVKKRDRFVWKESCVSLLEKFYCVNPYPDDTKREEIAAACNQLIDSTGQGHDEKLVTAVKVYNWFANRRKEIKRKSHFAEQQANSQNLSILSPGSAVLPFLLDSKPHSKHQSFIEDMIQQRVDLNASAIKEEYLDNEKTGAANLKLCQMVGAINNTNDSSKTVSIADQLAEVNNTISELVPSNEDTSFSDQVNDNQHEAQSANDEHMDTRDTLDILNLTSDISKQ